MSDPVTNVEIEDILSSIRRLVSSEGRSVGPLVREAPKGPGRLVLTPALRVDEAARMPPEPSQDAVPEHEATGRDELRFHRGTPLRAAHDPAASEDGQAPDLHPDAGFADDGADSAPPDAAEAGDMPDRSAELTARVAELEHIVARSAEHWEPDGQSSDEYSGGPVAPLLWEDYVPEGTGAPAGDDASDQDAAPAPPDDRAHGSSPDAAADLHWDDDVPDSGDSTGDDQDRDELEPQPEAAQMHSDPIADTAPRPEQGRDDHTPQDDSLLVDDDDILDEDALRDLVAEIVRQELQGALGERITRNVRKLVRREIHRALTAQELD